MAGVHVLLMVLYLIVQDYQAPKFQAPIEILSLVLPERGMGLSLGYIYDSVCVYVIIRYLIATYDGNALN